MNRLGWFVVCWCCGAALGPLVGAEPNSHWAYRPLTRPLVPTVADRRWPLDPIDAFVQARLEREVLAPTPTADRITLFRRATLALTGLPPTLEELDDYSAEAGPDAFERVVDRLLASPQHGERLAIWWLDLARYADTHGYHADTHRDMWRWREWVIDALNHGMPFDQFTIEQLAGDLLPAPTIEQRLATGFLRNNMVIFENGVIDEEYRSEYVADRVATVGTVWLGQTMQCARCHDHKHDPFTQRDYYRLYAFFNNVPEKGVDGRYGNAAPLLTASTTEQRAREEMLSRNLARREQGLSERLAKTDDAQRGWERQRARNSAVAPPGDPAVYFALDETKGDVATDRAQAGRSGKIFGQPMWVAGRRGNALLLNGETWLEAGNAGDFDRNDALTICAWVFPTTEEAMTIAARQLGGAAPRGYDLSLDELRPRWRMIAEAGRDELIVSSKQRLAPRRWQQVTVTVEGKGTAAGVRLFVDGRECEVVVERDQLTRSPRNAAPLEIGRRAVGDYWRGMLDEVRVYERALSLSEIASLAGEDLATEIIAVPEARRTATQSAALRRLYLEERDADFRDQQRQWATLQHELTELRKSFPTAMVMEELATPRPTFVLRRGQYDQPGDLVEPGTPDWLMSSVVSVPPSQQPVRGARATRLDLALWLVRPDHPLTARVTVSRVWQLHFGTGLVPTSDDFGTHGQPPTHPELLDWLASDFAGSLSWDLKRLQRRIVTSATFRQSRTRESKLAQRDPDRRLLAGGPSWRLPAELIRDMALATSGLLDRRVGGPSVFPYQPAGLWEEVAYDTQSLSAQTYRPSHGRDLYRRGLYTYWKRAVTSPALAAFDAPDREVCVASRPTTVTPQQSLVLMNEPARIEAARVLAERAWRASGGEPSALVDHLFRLVTSQLPTAERRAVLQELFHAQRDDFHQQPAAAERLLSVGEFPVNRTLPAADLAAWTTVANVVLSLDAALYLP